MIPKTSIWRVTFWSGKIKVAVLEVFAPTKMLARLGVLDAMCEPHNTLQRERWLAQRHNVDRITYYRTRGA